MVSLFDSNVGNRREMNCCSAVVSWVMVWSKFAKRRGLTLPWLGIRGRYCGAIGPEGSLHT